jgi:riboflavin kinase
MGKHTQLSWELIVNEQQSPRTSFIQRQQLLILLELVKEGASNGLTITSKTLGQLLGVAQQSASRYLVSLEKEELIHRKVSPFGQKITITSKGMNLLYELHSELEKALGIPFKEITLKGEVVSGLGEGGYYITMPGYFTQIQEKLGFTPFPGTLNIKLGTLRDFQKFQELRQAPSTKLEPFSADGRTYGYVDCYHVIINEQVEGTIVRSERTHHGDDIIEIISPVNLRKQLDIRDGSIVVIRSIPNGNTP